MNKIEKLHESIRALFRSEGEKFCYIPGEIERLVCSLNYKQLYSVLCDMAEPVFTCCAGGVTESELADPMTIDDEALRLIMNALLIAKYGTAAFHLKGDISHEP